MELNELIKADHREVEMLFAEFERRYAKGFETTGQAAEAVLLALNVHARLEEELVYPALKPLVEEPLDVLEAIEEHHVAKLLIKELMGMSLEDERYLAKMNVLMDMVRDHVTEEEEYLLPLAQEKLTLAQAGDLSRQYADAKLRAEQQQINLHVSMVREYPVEQPKER